MEFKELVEKRYSVRGFLPNDVESDKIDYVLECARKAPSACNKQPWHFYVIKSDEGKRAIRDSYPRDWFATAPMYIVVAAAPSKAWVRPEDGHNASDIDAAIATEHICLAAAAIGLGTCWVCNYDPEKALKAIGSPKDFIPVAILPIGYPDAEPRPTVRNSMDEIVTYL